MQATLLLIYFFSTALSFHGLGLEISIIYLICSISFLSTILFLLIRLSGTPYKNIIYRVKAQRLTFIVVLWCIVKGVRRGFGIQEETFIETMIKATAVTLPPAQ